MRRIVIGLAWALSLGWLGATEPLRVLIWNTERGSNPYGPDGKERVLKVIRESGADVVLWQESYQLEGREETLGKWVADEMGWEIWQGESPHLAVASRFPQVGRAFHDPWHGLGVRLRDDDGREFVAWSIWLDYREPVQWAATDHPEASDDDLLACETSKSGRFGEAQALLDDLDRGGVLQSQVPVLVGGDWNCPSHLDWTAETANAFPHRRSLPLPVSRLMAGADFADCYRFLHPDPVQDPGNTWSPRGTPREDGSPDPPERIDRMYLKNALGKPGLQPVRATIFPRDPKDAHAPRESAVFPSDHAATLFELEWVETDSATAGAFLPEPAAASPALDHQGPEGEMPDYSPTRISWGSCFQESNPCPMLDTLAAEKPELYLALGDNIYGDSEDMGVLRLKYRRLARQPGWRALTKSARVMATWDDHDYGANDSGSDYRPQGASREIFLDFFDVPAGSARRNREGVYTSTILGTEKERVQIILLDLRTFRTPLASDVKAYPELGDLRVLREDEPQEMLGETQWKWLEEELQKPAELRLIGLSTQLGASHNGFESWANLPRERERFLELLERSKAEGVVLLSGDTHYAEISLIERPGLYPLYDLTASSLNQVWDPAGANVNRLGQAYTSANAGVMEIDWASGSIKTKIIDEWGQSRLALEIRLDELKFGRAYKQPEIAGEWRSAFGNLVLSESAEGWQATYPGGRCELQRTAGGFAGRWIEPEKSGRCTFELTRCGRFLQGAYGRGEGPMILPWPAWRADAEGASFGIE